MLKIPSTWINARLDKSYYGLSHPFKDPGRLWIVWQASKGIGAVSLQYQLKLNALRSLSVSTDKTRKNWDKLFADILDVNFSCFSVRDSLLQIVQAFKHFTCTLYFKLYSKDIKFHSVLHSYFTYATNFFITTAY